MTTLTGMEDRRMYLFGTRDYLEGDDERIRVSDSLTDRETVHQVEEITVGTQTQIGGYGGGDYCLMDRSIHAVMANDQSMILSGPNESLEGHLMVFTTERARKENCLVML